MIVANALNVVATDIQQEKAAEKKVTNVQIVTPFGQNEFKYISTFLPSMEKLFYRIFMEETAMESVRYSERSITGYIPLEAPIGESTHIEVCVRYSKGGMSYYDYKTYPSAYWLHVKPVKIGDGMITSTMGSGSKHNLELAERYNRKKLLQYWNQAEKSISNEDYIGNKMMKSAINKETMESWYVSHHSILLRLTHSLVYWFENNQ